MRNKLQDFVIIIFISFLLLIVLEITLGLFFDYKKSQYPSSKIDRILTSNAYTEKDTTWLTQFYNDYNKLTYEWDPFTTYKLKSYQGTTINIDQDGRRETINTNSIDIDTDSIYTIYCFGGSTMFGEGARDTKTIPSLISKELTERIPTKKILITNYGVPAYNRSQETAQLLEELKQGKKPNIVIFYDGFNEVLIKHPNYYQNVQQPIKKSYEAVKKSKKQLKLALQSSNINTAINKIQNKLKQVETESYDIVINDSIINEILERYRNNIKIVDAISTHYNLKVFNYLQPNIYSKKNKTEYESIQYNNQKGLDIVFHKLYKQFTSDSIIQKSTNFNDLSKCFDTTKENIFLDNCHISEYGNSIVSKIIANDIIQFIKNN